LDDAGLQKLKRASVMIDARKEGKPDAQDGIAAERFEMIDRASIAARGAGSHLPCS